MKKTIVVTWMLLLVMGSVLYGQERFTEAQRQAFMERAAEQLRYWSGPESLKKSGEVLILNDLEMDSFFPDDFFHRYNPGEPYGPDRVDI